MAKPLVAYISQESINANPVEHSPITSSPFEKEAAPVQGIDHERIEDSYEKRLEGGAVQRHVPAGGDELEDDLYAVSPKGKAALDAAKGSVKAVEIPKGGNSDIKWEEASRSRTNNAAAEKARPKSPRKCQVSDLVERSAIAQDTQVPGHRVAQNAKMPAPQGKVNSMAGLSDASTTVRPSFTAGQRGATQIVQNGRSALTQRHAKPSGSGSMDALRAKKGLPNTQTLASATKSSRATQGFALSRSPLQERSRNVPTQSRSGPGAQGSARPPVKTTSTNDQTVPVNPRPSGKLRESALDHAAQYSAYDFPDSPGATKTTTAHKRTKAVAEPPPRKQVRKTRKGKADISDDFTDHETSKGRRQDSPYSVGRAAKHAPQSSKPVRKQPPRRSKGGVHADDEAIGSGRPRSYLEATDHDLEPDDGGKKARAPAKTDNVGHDETIEDFEQEVLNLDNDEYPAAGPPKHPKPSLKSRERVSPPNLAQTMAAEAVRAAEREHESDQEAGGDQEGEVIVLSDRVETSSPARSASVASITAPPNAAPDHKRPRKALPNPHTPAAPRSSPPSVMKNGADADHPRIIDASATLKSNIISFDRSGPRNQGTISMRKVDTGLVRPKRTSSPKRVPRFSLAHATRMAREAKQNAGSSSVANSKKTVPDRPASRGNVAIDMNDALSAFTRKDTLLVLPPKTTSHRRSPQKASLHASTLELERGIDETDDFTLIDDIDGPTLVDTQAVLVPRQAAVINNGRTASQQVMPPPPANLAKPTKSRQAPAVQAIANHAVDKPAHVSSIAAPVQTSKRALSPAAPTDDRSKRHKADGGESVQPGKQGNLLQLSQNEDQPVCARATSSVRRPPHAAVLKPRKPSRHASQGTVDINGSPIPRDLVIVNERTVLETFSQNTSISSDEILGGDEIVVGHTALQGTKADVRSGKPHLPNVQPKALSSNTKARPASSNAGPRMTFKIVVDQEAQDDRLLGISTELSTANPFSGSVSARKAPARTTSPSVLAAALRTTVTGSEIQWQNQAEMDHDHEAYAIFDPPHQSTSYPVAQRKATGMPPPSARDDQADQSQAEVMDYPQIFADLVQKEKKRLTKAATDRNGILDDMPTQEPEDDPDRTLIEHEPPSKRQELPTKLPEPRSKQREPQPKRRELKRQRSVSTDDSSDMSEDLDTQTSAMRDIGLWREALQPHQMNLFDELVNISHRLVAHLVDRETSARHVVEDFHRRGERIVEVMQQSHLREYQHSVNLLQERQKQTRKALVKTSEELEICKTAIAQAKEKRAAKREERGRNVRRLEGLLADLMA